MLNRVRLYAWSPPLSIRTSPCSVPRIPRSNRMPSTNGKAKDGAPAGHVHSTAIVDPRAEVGEGTKVWAHAQIREHAKVGRGCVISKDVYIDHGVTIGDHCKIQNSVSVFNGVTIEDDVFVGPSACFTNDLLPRARNEAWQASPTIVRRGASIGANATIVCGVVVGEYAMIAAGAVVTRDVEPFALVMGNPA